MRYEASVIPAVVEPLTHRAGHPAKYRLSLDKAAIDDGWEILDLYVSDDVARTIQCDAIHTDKRTRRPCAYFITMLDEIVLPTSSFNFSVTRLK